MKYDVAVIGGGAAGCMAASRAGKRGLKTVLLESNTKVGRKIMITGKGRCNVTNDVSADGVIKNTVRNPRFLYSSVNAFSPCDTKSFFTSLGVKLKTERGNRVFPESDKSSDIVDALYNEVRRRSTLKTDFCVQSITNSNDIFTVKSVKGETINAAGVIIATGGLSYSATGSTGDGYRFAEDMGHTVIQPAPSLVPILSNDRFISQLQGISLRNVTMTLCEKGKKKPVFFELGEMLFTHNGISGPLALSASCFIVNEPESYRIYIDLKPGLTAEQLDARILRDFAKYTNRNLSNALCDLLPSGMIPVVVSLCDITDNTKVNSVTKEQRDMLAQLLKALPVRVDGLGSMNEAIITRGGVNVKEINPVTMESKLVKNLHFAGEVIDCDAFTGGFNLQIAFSTGYAAGEHILHN